MQKIKSRVKRLFADAMYLLFSKGILKNPIKVCSIDETIQALVKSDKSLIRIGDGEIKLMEGRDIANQKADEQLSQGLCRVLGVNDDSILIAIPNIFCDISMFNPRSQCFWKEHLLFLRKVYYRYCDHNRVYYDAFFSRPYIMFRDRKRCGDIFHKIKGLWDQKHLIFVEGEVSHNGVDNDLFDNAARIERIICPSTNAFDRYDAIRSACLHLPRECLIAMSIGAAGKLLAIDLVKEGFRVIDIGSLDMEYGWYLQGALDKCYVKKHYISSREDNIREGYTTYLEEIRATIY